jgi:hypothetical protein
MTIILGFTAYKTFSKGFETRAKDLRERKKKEEKEAEEIKKSEGAGSEKAGSPNNAEAAPLNVKDEKGTDDSNTNNNITEAQGSSSENREDNKVKANAEGEGVQKSKTLVDLPESDTDMKGADGDAADSNAADGSAESSKNGAETVAVVASNAKKFQ